MMMPLYYSHVTKMQQFSYMQVKRFGLFCLSDYMRPSTTTSRPVYSMTFAG